MGMEFKGKDDRWGLLFEGVMGSSSGLTPEFVGGFELTVSHQVVHANKQAVEECRSAADRSYRVVEYAQGLVIGTDADTGCAVHSVGRPEGETLLGIHIPFHKA